MKRMRVLIATADRKAAFELAANLRRLGLAVRLAHELESSQTLLNYFLPDLLVADDQWHTALAAAGAEKDGGQAAGDVPAILLCSAERLRAGQVLDRPAYRVLCDERLWRRVEPVVYELVDLPSDEPESAAPHQREG